MNEQTREQEPEKVIWRSIEEWKAYEKEHYHRTSVVVDLDAIRHNIREVNAKLRTEDSCAGVMAVVKADAYGHGVTEVVRALRGVAAAFAVATAEEALELRRIGVTETILILGYVSPREAKDLIPAGITLTVYSKEQARELNDLAQSLSRPGEKPYYVKVHLALDTGMTRIGFLPGEEALSEIRKIREMEHISIEGMFTHLSCADMKDKAYSEKQIASYDAFAEELKKAGIEIPMRHLCNSAAIMDFDHHRYEYVRSGIITYGLLPSDEVNAEALSLQPALSWLAHVVHVKEVPAGVAVSYGATFVTTRTTKIATVGIGYADGYMRHLSGKGRVLIRGKSAPILGRVCMDQMMVDVTDIPEVAREDVVTLIGRDDDEFISAEEMAEAAGTINYEIVCAISKRVRRVYVRKDGESPDPGRHEGYEEERTADGRKSEITTFVSEEHFGK